MFYLLKYHLCPKVIHELDELQCEVINSFEYGLIITDDHEQVIHTNDVFNHILQQLGREAPEDLTATRVEGTLFGNGERTGNVDIYTFSLRLNGESSYM